MKRIAIIGHFGGKEKFYDGQTVKTLTLYQALLSTGRFKIYKVDTYYNKTNKIKLLWQTLVGLCTCRHVIILLSLNGMKVFFPLLYWVQKVLPTRVYHDLIGGKLDAILLRCPTWCKYVNSFAVNWVELPSLEENLQKMGIANAQVLPNFKELPILQTPARESTNKDHWKFCTFSRVCEEKGITEAIETVGALQKQHPQLHFQLDVWGPVEKKYQSTLDHLLKEYPCATYRGISATHKSVEVLSVYDVLLFPTHWRGEGFPGTLLDAFAAGLPCVASDWNGNKEVLSHGKTGLLYPWQDIPTLQEGILWAIAHPKEWYQMRLNCLNEAQKYTVKNCLPKILQELDK